MNTITTKFNMSKTNVLKAVEILLPGFTTISLVLGAAITPQGDVIFTFKGGKEVVVSTSKEEFGLTETSYRLLQFHCYLAMENGFFSPLLEGLTMDEIEERLTFDFQTADTTLKAALASEVRAAIATSEEKEVTVSEEGTVTYKKFSGKKIDAAVSSVIGFNNKHVRKVRVKFINNQPVALQVTLEKGFEFAGKQIHMFETEVANAFVQAVFSQEYPTNTVGMVILPTATDESSVAVENIQMEELPMTEEPEVVKPVATGDFSYSLNVGEASFKSVLQNTDFGASVHKKVEGKLEVIQVLSMAASAQNLQAFLTTTDEDGRKQIGEMFDMRTIEEERAHDLALEGSLRGLNLQDHIVIREIETPLLDGGTKTVETFTFSDNVILVATEDNSVEEFPITEGSQYQTSNESAAARVASRNKIVRINTYNSKGELTPVKYYDGTNTAVLDFNTSTGIVNQLLIDSIGCLGVHFRMPKAPRNIEELSSMSQLVLSEGVNDSPSQNRQSKVTMFIDGAHMSKYQYLLGLNNRIKAYGKIKTVEVEGKEKEMYEFDIMKNATRKALLASASKKFSEFGNILGKFVKAVSVANGTELIFEKEKILLTHDIESEFQATSKVFNTEVAKYKPGNKQAKASVLADIQWVANVTDGGSIYDKEVFAKGLQDERFIHVLKTGRERGAMFQYRAEGQVKGALNGITGVKEATGYAMILFDGSTKTDLAQNLVDGMQFDMHIMLVAYAAEVGEKVSVSSQMLNNLDLDAEFLIETAEKEQAAIHAKIHNIDTRMEAIKELFLGKDLVSMQDSRNILSEDFGIQKFAMANPAVFKDVYAASEIASEYAEYVKKYSQGRIYVEGTNNYMQTDLWAQLTAVKAGLKLGTNKVAEYSIPKECVVIARMDKDGKRYFHTGEIASLRSPHTSLEGTQVLKAIDPRTAMTPEQADWWYKQLEDGNLDGVTYFSTKDLSAVSSDGADFDGDTSCIIFDEVFVAAIKAKLAQRNSRRYVDFHTLEGERAYIFTEGVLTGAYVKDGVVMTAKELEAAKEAGEDLEISTDSTVILGSGCPWETDVPAPAFDLPAGMYQDRYKLYIPVEMIEEHAAYKAWVDATVKVMFATISVSEIGQKANVAMAIANGINLIEKLLVTAEGEDKLMLEEELDYYNNMKDVAVAVAWWAIDAAKHGGAFKTALAKWIGWMENAELKFKEMKKETHLSMRRIISYLPKSMDEFGNVDGVKVGIVLPAVLVEAKYKKSSIASNAGSNIQLYAKAMKEKYKEALADKNSLPVLGNNLLKEILGYIVSYPGEFNSAIALDTYKEEIAKFEKGNSELAESISNMKDRTRFMLASSATDFDAMNTSKQTHLIKKMFPEYHGLRMKQKQLVATTKQLLRVKMVEKGLDPIMFAATVYSSVYREALAKEKSNSQGYYKAGIYSIWKFLADEMIFLLSSIEGANFSMKEIDPLTVNLSMTKIYMKQPNPAFAKAAKLREVMAGKELRIAASKEFRVFNAFISNIGEDTKVEDFIGKIEGSAAFELIEGFSYRMSNPTVVSKTKTGGLTIEFSQTRVFGNKYEGVKPVAAIEFQSKAAEASFVLPLVMQEDAKMQDMVSDTFALARKGDVLYVAQVLEGEKTLVAKTAVPSKLKLEEGKFYAAKGELSDFDGTPKLFIFKNKNK